MRDTLGLYVHIPFCTAKCGYCDFNSYAGQEHLMGAYVDALVRESASWSARLRGRTVETVFFGGGTPSLTPIPEMRRLLAALRAAFDIASGAEVTLEANPGTLDEAYLRELRALGVNRLSIGVQSLHDDELRALDRIHSADDARAAFAAARAAGFDNINLDLIYGLPEQQMERWQATLEGALALAPEHLSLYALTVEEGTPLARDVARGRTPAPDGDAQADQYEWTQERAARAGYEHYEISNWARPGRRCRHNMVYWENREYLGLGAGAHSHVDGVRFYNARLPQRYIDLVSPLSVDGDVLALPRVAGGERVALELARADGLILGLRLVDGVDLAGYELRYGASPYELYGDTLHEFEGYGFLERADGRLRLTPRGRLLSNELFARLLP